MAAPTSVRVEAISTTSTIIRWSYAGSNGLTLYYSTDGGSNYSVRNAGILATDTSYTDTGLDTGTRYFYKLSDDFGSTFSSAVSVYTHFCADQSNANTFGLPRFDGDAQQAESLNAMAERIENALGLVGMNETQCIACPTNGSVVIDCTDGCRDWYVIADEDINSVSIVRCGNQGPQNLTFVIPPSTTVGICGFPAGWGFTGDECTEAPISGGTRGRFVTSSASGGVGGGSGIPNLGKPATSGRGTGTGGGGGAGCDCVPGQSGELTIKCCTANCSLSCQSSKAIQLKVCGGIGPYSWSKTGSGIKFKGTGDETTDTTTKTGTQVTVRPTVNTGSAVSGKAYSKTIVGVGCGHSVGTTHAAGVTAASYNCDDALNTCPDGAVSTTETVGAFLDSTCACSTHNGHTVSGGGSVTTVSCSNIYASGQECAAAQAVGAMTDLRSAGMISSGCTPCGLNDGATVTVTDATGVSVSITLKS